MYIILPVHYKVAPHEKKKASTDSRGKRFFVPMKKMERPLLQPLRRTTTTSESSSSYLGEVWWQVKHEFES